MQDALEAAWRHITAHAREMALLESVDSLLNWDERTMLPSRGGAFRAEQITLVTRLLHERRTDPRYGEQLARLQDAGWETAADDQESERVLQAAALRELRRDYDRHTRLPPRLVEELARTSVLGQQAWVEARRRNDYALFQPLLDTMIRLKREQAEALGFEGTPYDALLDEFEPGARTDQVTRVLQDLRAPLVELVQAIRDARRDVRSDVLRGHFPQAVQESFGRQVAQRIGFDFERGRLDITHHPFCSSMGPDDCRITTRYDESFFSTAFFGILHETGHGLYEQGLRPDWFGMAPGMACSLGIHESQSRLWENFVGRSRAFWNHWHPLAHKHFAGAWKAASASEIYEAVNRVEPSLIRVEADEATYNLHIIVRFELEQSLISGDLTTADLPSAWNEQYAQTLGISPDSDANGVLQDIHWSAGLFGYFPTYTLGNLYAAQFCEAARREVGDLDAAWEAGEFQPLLEWLRARIHHAGRCCDAATLCRRVTGRPLGSEALLQHLHAKLDPLYGLS